MATPGGRRRSSTHPEVAPSCGPWRRAGTCWGEWHQLPGTCQGPSHGSWTGCVVAADSGYAASGSCTGSDCPAGPGTSSFSFNSRHIGHAHRALETGHQVCVQQMAFLQYTISGNKKECNLGDNFSPGTDEEDKHCTVCFAVC